MNKIQNTKHQIPKTQKGITLVALVITIIVLLILAVVAIRAIQNDSIINYAKNSVDEYERAHANEQSLLQGYIDKIQNSTGQGPVTNPYDPDDWDYAWVCNDGTWGDMLSAGETAEGDIVAKFYKTENKITPPNIIFNDTTYIFEEGDSYKLVIEGTGEMGPLMTIENDNIKAGFGWQTQTAMYMAGYANTCIMPYVTEVIICDGITNIGVGALGADVTLSNIKISSTVKTIGDYAFIFSGLNNITIQNSVTSIGDSAFRDCAALTSITIGNSVTSIGDDAFLGCDALTSITIPDSVTSIGDYAFYSCDALTSITIGNSVTSIGDSAFSNCAALTSITIPNSVTSIGDHAFDDCDALTSVTIPDSVTSIGNYAFYSCDALTSITIPNSVTSIGYYAFSNCDALTNVYIETTSSELVVGNGAFEDMSSNSTIWVRNESVANALSGKYNSGRTTVSTDYNWTAPTN